MPATERGFFETPPQRLYVDTDFILTYLVSPRPHHARCRAFIERVQGMAITTLYVSSLVWLEYAHVITRPAFRSALPEQTQREFVFEHESAHSLGRGRGTYLAVQYRRLTARRGKKKAAVALGHSILIIVYHLLSRGEVYHDLGVQYFDEGRRRTGSTQHNRRLTAAPRPFFTAHPHAISTAPQPLRTRGLLS